MTELLLIRQTLEQAEGWACVTCSFQAEDVVVLHLLRQVQRDIPVLFLDTGYHIPALLRYRDRLAESWDLNLVNVTNDVSRKEHENRFGRLFRTDATACCRKRKVEPLFMELENYSVWFTGLRREQSPTRAHLQVTETTTLPSGHMLSKVSPLAEWDWKQVWSYISANDIPYLPLYDQGYTSIGCEPCTVPPRDPSNARSGRWGGKKLECGIHIFTERS
jgi:phosphoadenosine phosphosulfate reductase